MAPLKIWSTWLVTGQPAAIVFAVDPDSAQRTMQGQLHNLYRLTAAQAAMVYGHGVPLLLNDIRFQRLSSKDDLFSIG